MPASYFAHDCAPICDTDEMPLMLFATSGCDRLILVRWLTLLAAPSPPRRGSDTSCYKVSNANFRRAMSFSSDEHFTFCFLQSFAVWPPAHCSLRKTFAPHCLMEHKKWPCLLSRLSSPARFGLAGRKRERVCVYVFVRVWQETDVRTHMPFSIMCSRLGCLAAHKVDAANGLSVNGSH